MVDFNNDSVSSKPPKEILNLVVIERWYNFQDSWEMYNRDKFKGVVTSLAIPRARLLSLYLVCCALLKRKLKADEYDKVVLVCTNPQVSTTADAILDCYYLINNVLDSIELTKIDTKQTYNRLDISKSNKAQGYG
jgi:hypothetical protein